MRVRTGTHPAKRLLTSATATMKELHILRSVGTVSLFTSLSRLLGMVRDILMASFFGTGVYMSAFVLAFTVPNLFRRLFGEGALAAAFIPVFVETRTQEGDDAAWVLAGRILGLLLVVLLGLLLLGWVLVWAGMVWTSSAMVGLTLSLLNVMLPYMVLICLAALAMSMLNAFKHFAVPAFAPCLLNIVWILCVLIGFKFLQEDDSVRIHALAWCILLAGGLQLIVQLPTLWRLGFRGRIELNLADAKVRRILLLMGPVALGMAVTQCNVMVDRLLAAVVGDHAVAALFFSERLIYLPLGMFATAMGTVLLPTLSRQAAKGQAADQLDTVQHSFRLLCFVMVPAAVGLFVLAEPVIRMLLAHGEFNDQSVFYTRTALQYYAPGLVLFGLAKIFVPVFYSHQDTKTPVVVGVGSVMVNLTLNIIFILTWPYAYKHAGLACATVISEGLYVVTLMAIFHRRYGSPGWGRMATSLLRFAATAALMGLFVGWGYQYLQGLLGPYNLPMKLDRIGAVLTSITAGGLLYFLLSALFRFPEWQTITGRFRSRG